jgi:hypothetical protein
MFSIRSISPGRAWIALAAVLSLGASGCLAPGALAIPEEEAIRKLAVIPVFMITDPKGVPIPIPRGKTLVLPLYLDRAKAEAEAALIGKQNPSAQVKVVPMPMDIANQQVSAMTRQIKDGYTLVAPMVPLANDLKQAEVILRNQGVSEAKIRQGLTVPVFFSKPFITLKTPQGERGVFFTSYEDFQKALSQMGATTKIAPQVADITAVLREIIKTPQDSFIFQPTREYFRLVQEQERRRGGGAAAGAARLSAPPPPPSAP